MSVAGDPFNYHPFDYAPFDSNIWDIYKSKSRRKSRAEDEESIRIKNERICQLISRSLELSEQVKVAELIGKLKTLDVLVTQVEFPDPKVTEAFAQKYPEYLTPLGKFSMHDKDTVADYLRFLESVPEGKNLLPYQGTNEDREKYYREFLNTFKKDSVIENVGPKKRYVYHKFGSKGYLQRKDYNPNELIYIQRIHKADKTKYVKDAIREAITESKRLGLTPQKFKQMTSII